MVLRADPRHLGIPIPESEKKECPKCKGSGQTPWVSKDGCSRGFMWCEECNRTGKKQPPKPETSATVPPQVSIPPKS